MRISLFLLLMLPAVAFSDALFYFHVGSNWTYAVEGNESYEVTNKVTEVKVVNGQNWYKLVEYGETFWVANTQQGQVEAINFFERNPSQLDKPETVLIYKFPAKVGEVWDHNGSPVTYLGISTLSVPAGQFECHMYNIDLGNSNYSKTCIAQNVGVVYNEAVLGNNPKEISKLLHFGHEI